VAFCAAAAGLALIGVTLTQLGDRSAPPAAGRDVRLPAAPVLPPPVPAAGTPSDSPSPPPPATRTSTQPATRPAGTAQSRRPPARTGAGPTRPPATEPTRAPAAPPPPALRPGAAVGLELADAPGHRVRHRDFRGRADRIGPGSSTLDRADARFLVRAGLADAGCVSFEASNYPGRFLRHRDFEIRLDRADGSGLFARDATFCPGSRAGVVVLRSHNYPDRFLTESGSRLRLTPATTGTATRYVVRSPL